MQRDKALRAMQRVEAMMGSQSQAVISTTVAGVVVVMRESVVKVVDPGVKTMKPADAVDSQLQTRRRA